MSRREADEGDEGEGAKTVHLDGFCFERVNEWLGDWRKDEKSEGRRTAYFFCFQRLLGWDDTGERVGRKLLCGSGEAPQLYGLAMGRGSDPIRNHGPY